MDYDRTFGLSVGVNIFKLKAFRNLKIQLGGGDSPGAVERIFNIKMYFWSVESALAFQGLIFKPELFQRLAQKFFRLFPRFYAAHRLFRTGGESIYDRKAQALVKFLRHF